MAPKTVPRDGFPNQPGCPREGAGMVAISQDECNRWVLSGSQAHPFHRE